MSPWVSVPLVWAVLLVAAVLAFSGAPSESELVAIALWRSYARALYPVFALLIGAAGLGVLLTRWMTRGPDRTAQSRPWSTTHVCTTILIGLAVEMVLLWILWTLGVTHAWTGWGFLLLGITILGSLWQSHRFQRDSSRKIRWGRPSWMSLLLLPGTAALLVAAACPPGTLWSVEAYGYDVLSYHLQLPREWIDRGAVRGLEHNVYSFFPSLMEVAYAQLMIMRPHATPEQWAWTAQLFHATTALLAAGSIGGVARRFFPRPAPLIAAALVLITPWVIVTGSSAYNEMLMLGFGAAALDLTLLRERHRVVSGPAPSNRPRSTRHRRAALTGLLLGAATLTKLTAGPMFAMPIGLMWLRPQPHSIRQRLTAFAIVTAVGLITLSPYLARNAIQTGNPVFPFATSVFGAGHWDETLVERWKSGHSSAQNDEALAKAADRQYFRNAGYGAIGGRETPDETFNIARFPREGGFPLILGAALIGAVLLLVSPVRKSLAASSAATGFRAVGRSNRINGLALVAMLALQLLFWLLATHLQSRFMVAAVLPTAVLAALAIHRIGQLAARTLRRPTGPVVAVVATLLILALTSHLIRLMAGQSRLVPIESRAPDGTEVTTMESFPIAAWMGAAFAPEDRHPINELPEDAQVLIVADNTSLFYLNRPFIYASAFDATLIETDLNLEDWTPDRVPAGPVDEASLNQVANHLRAAGITHVWFSPSEVQRLSNTYGFNPNLATLLTRATAVWPTQIEPGGIMLSVPGD